MFPLGLLASGECAQVVEMMRPTALSPCARCGCGPGRAGSYCRAEDLGLRVGKTVQMLHNSRGALLVKVDGARIALGRGLAMKIMVRRDDG